MVAVVVFEFSGMRCQPLRRALGLWRSREKNTSDPWASQYR
ncbi:acetyltransferase [Vibrio cholerae]|nr:acetyltransferase [Vibrio cholerae]EKE8763127.1 acetyltransferase [Vibrio cholerae]EKF9299225.1 acetyltransferase [Vibrio cholerae]EKF9937308.1 acetyltransferase [Vibrio cholerae]